jgi:Carboxypeptidase regulatory-like domain
MRQIALWLALAGALGLSIPAGPAEAQTVITGTVQSKAGRPLAGLALLEKGQIHNNVWDRGAVVDAQGHFRIEVAAGGSYGLHVYSSGYIYSPQAIRVETGKTLEVQVALAPEPTRANTPVIRKVGFFPWEGHPGVTFVKADVADPRNILGPQVLAFDAGAGRAYALEPPQKVRDLKANFPNGVYQLQVDTRARPMNPRDWHFVVADHQCNTSDILSFPHEPKPAQMVQ